MSIPKAETDAVPAAGAAEEGQASPPPATAPVPVAAARRGRALIWLGLPLAILAVAGLAWLYRAAYGVAAAGDGSGPGLAAPVRVAAVVRGDLDLYAEYPGELVADAADLAARVGGRIAGVTVRPGDRVAEGALLARLDDIDLRRELEEARARLAVVRANRDRAAARLREQEAGLGRAHTLMADALISQQELERIEAEAGTGRADVAAAEAAIAQAEARAQILEQQLAETRLLAPFDGVVASRYLDPGAVVQPGAAVVRLVQAGPLRAQFRVPERDLGRIAVGSPFTIVTQATGAATFRGEVRRLSGEVGRADRTLLVEGVIEGEPEVLRSGMYAAVRVRLDRLTGAVLVPGMAVSKRVKPSGLEEVGVFTLAAGGERADWRPVTMLGQEGGRVAIEGDVAPGDRVLTLGYEELSDGSPVQVVEAPPPAGDAP